MYKLVSRIKKKGKLNTYKTALSTNYASIHFYLYIDRITSSFTIETRIFVLNFMIEPRSLKSTRKILNS